MGFLGLTEAAAGGSETFVGQGEELLPGDVVRSGGDGQFEILQRLLVVRSRFLQLAEPKSASP